MVQVHVDVQVHVNAEAIARVIAGLRPRANPITWQQSFAAFGRELRRGKVRSSSMHSLRTPSLMLHALVLIAFAVPYFVNLGVSSLWDSNEAFYAETPREMLLTGDYVAPQFNFQPRTQKPPLTYWVVVVSYRLFGIREFSVRLPGALAATGVLLFTYGLARNLFGAPAALIAAIILSTTTRFFILARRLPIDILLLFWLTGTAFFLVRAITKNSRANWAFAYLFTSLAFLTKGPIGLVVPAASYALWSIWLRRFRFSSAHPWMGALIGLAVIAPWYVLIYAAHGWTYIASFFLRDNLGRFATEDFGPARNLLFYVPAYLADFFPWSLLTPWTLYCLWKGRAEAGEPARFGSAFLLAWCGFVFVFFSLARNKEEYYIAPLYPTAAVLIGAVLERARKTALPHRQQAVKSLQWSYVVISAGLLVLSALLLGTSRSFLPQLPVALLRIPAIILLLTFVALAYQLVRGRQFECFKILSASLLALFICASALYLPAIETFRPVKELCQVIASESQPDDDAGYFRATAPSMVYYLRRPIFEEYDAGGMAHRFQLPRRVLCLMTKPDYDYLVGSRNLTLYIWDHRPRLVTQLRSLLERNQVSNQDLFLVSNRPKPEKGGRVSL